jgi:hypothetical protein
MVERLVASGMLTQATYTVIDLEPTLIAEARRRLPQWAAAQGLQVQQDSQEQLHMQQPGQDISVETDAIDLLRFIAREQGQRTWDLLIAQALLDLVDVPTTFQRSLSSCGQAGSCIAPSPLMVARSSSRSRSGVRYRR